MSITYSPPQSIHEASCADDYDPNSMPVAKAKEFIAKFLKPINGVIRVPLRDALGRVLAEDIVSPINVPSHINSAMDGWAVRAADLQSEGETTLTEIGASFAGAPFGKLVRAGECVRIMTGAVVPEGADTVVMQERVKADGKKITLSPGQKSGQNVRHPGEDLKQGAVALYKGRLVRPAELGLIASLGIGEVSVHRPLRVAFFSTGDELRPVGTPLGEGQLYDSNRYTIFGMLKRLGCDVMDMGVIRDVPELLESAFKEASQVADVVITSGGVSVGEADFVKTILNQLGEVVFWKIAMKPGRPLAYGKIGDAHFFGLPGNPVSAMVTLYQFVRAALLSLMGVNPVPTIPILKAKCVSNLKKAPGRMEFQRGVLTQDAVGEWTVKATGEQGSGILKSMSDANCFIILDEQTGNVAAGTVVDVQVLEGVV
ncbi:MAG TPA: gephyrin-like molybdotransferase Glp [Burkholderiales bacterium]|nr:gephyrin-like molybdotransferase Glp [Burkholderiales bacterium]